MEQTFLCVLGLFSLNLLFFCGQAEVVLTVEPNWTTFFPGEFFTLICDVKEGRETDFYLFSKDGLRFTDYIRHKTYIGTRGTGHYSCSGRNEQTLQWEESNKVLITVLVNGPKAMILEAGTYIPTGDAVMLTCSVSQSTTGWEYEWYRGKKDPQLLTAEGAVFHSNDRISVSQEGFYWCIGRRGNPHYYTEYSDTFVAFTPVVKLNHNWPEILHRERISLMCEIKDGGDIVWEYEWKKQQEVLQEKKKEYVVVSALISDNGDYMCRARSSYGQTRWSKAFTLTVIDSPNLSVSSSWPNPGASVNLNCAVEHLSAGWRFYWYKIIPVRGQYREYNYELLPGSTNRTKQDSYVVYNHTNTTGYACRAGRGDPEHSTFYSNHKFVWSGEFQSQPSLRVSPDRVQHFSSDSVSLTCEGNSTQWTVVRFGQEDFRSYRCSSFGKLTGSTCITELYQHAVYWCVSKSGQFSSAVNISASYKGILLESPVHPVAEGAVVTLRCRLKTGNFVANIVFYQNDKVVQNDTRLELTIPAVSKSDEGFYRCEGKYSHWTYTLTSPQSWISVKSWSKPESSHGHLPLIVGLVCGVLVIIPLLLLLLVFCYRMSKETKETQSSEYASPHGDVCHYETINPHEATENETEETQNSVYASPHVGPRDVVYSSVEIKKRHEINGKKSKPDKGCVYSDLKTRSDADDGQLYAQVHSCSEDKRKSTHAVAEETVYSEIKPGQSSDE